MPSNSPTCFEDVCNTASIRVTVESNLAAPPHRRTAADVVEGGRGACWHSGRCRSAEYRSATSSRWMILSALVQIKEDSEDNFNATQATWRPAQSREYLFLCNFFFLFFLSWKDESYNITRKIADNYTRCESASGPFANFSLCHPGGSKFFKQISTHLLSQK